MLLYISEKKYRTHYMSLDGFYIEVYMRKKKWRARRQNRNKILSLNYLKEIDYVNFENI